MKIKKTLYTWLTNRFLLIIRNEENFAEKRTFSFNYAKVIVFGITFLVLVFTLSFYLLNTLLYSLNPEYKEAETNKKLVFLSNQVDSLVKEIQSKEVYGNNLQRILTGQASSIYADTVSKRAERPSFKDLNLDSISPSDLLLRKQIEGEEGIVRGVKLKAKIDQDNYFIKPVEGFITRKFDINAGIYGIEMAIKPGEIVKAVADGMVIFSSYEERGYMIGIQHKNGFISIYKQNAKLLKNNGEFVSGGEALAISSAESNEKVQKKIYFELWKEGTAMNPVNFISF